MTLKKMNAVNEPASLKLDGDNVRDDYWKYILNDFQTYVAAANLSNAFDDLIKAIFVNLPFLSLKP